MLTTQQIEHIRRFTKEIFDKRLDLALDNARFKDKSRDEQAKWKQEKLRFYGAIAINGLDPKPSFRDHFKEVLQIMSESSELYK